MHHIRVSDTAAQFNTTSNGATSAPQYYSRAIFEAHADAIVITDTHGVITDVNYQMVEISGCTRSELIGLSWFSFCSDSVSASVAFGRALTEDRVSDVAIVLKNVAGTETSVTYNAAPIYNSQNNLVGVYANLRKATELHLMMLELNTQNNELDGANRMKSDFLATMSHELRTPLTAILGFSEALLCGLLGKIADEQAEYIQDIHDSGQHLLRLIDDILDLAKIDAGVMQMHLETADFRHLLAQSVSQTSRSSCNHRIQMEIQEDTGPLVTELDLRKTQKIIDHMLSNAVKFSAPDGEIHIHASKVSRSSVGKLPGDAASYEYAPPASDCPQFVQLIVRDNGIGIAPDDLPKVYNLFTQIESGLERRFEGTGLGISIVQRLAGLLGGTTAIASREGVGTSFAVWLPTHATSETALDCRRLPH